MKKTIVTLLALAGTAFAADSYTWNGGATINNAGWKNQANWQPTQGTSWTNTQPEDDDPNKDKVTYWNADSNGPATEGSNMWGDIYISGATGTVTSIIEGWSLDLHLTNGTALTFNRIKKLQGGTTIEIDETSSLTINEWWGGYDGGSIILNNKGTFTINYSCHVQGGDGFVMNLYDAGTVTFLDQNHDSSDNTAKVASITAQLTGAGTGILERQLITLDNRENKKVSFDGTTTAYSFTDANGTVMTKVDSLEALATAVAPSYYVTKDDSGIKVSYVLVPEPTTATLSLLALCGLAARRRRK